MNGKHVTVEIHTNGDWEAGYRLSRENLDKVYMYMDMLQAEETDEVDVSAATDIIESRHREFNA